MQSNSILVTVPDMKSVISVESFHETGVFPIQIPTTVQSTDLRHPLPKWLAANVDAARANLAKHEPTRLDIQRLQVELIFISIPFFAQHFLLGHLSGWTLLRVRHLRDFVGLRMGDGPQEGIARQLQERISHPVLPVVNYGILPG